MVSGQVEELPDGLRLDSPVVMVSTYNPQAYGPTPFSPRDSHGSC
jgi:hypothetical protein